MKNISCSLPALTKDKADLNNAGDEFQIQLEPQAYTQVWCGRLASATVILSRIIYLTSLTVNSDQKVCAYEQTNNSRATCQINIDRGEDDARRPKFHCKKTYGDHTISTEESI